MHIIIKRTRLVALSIKVNASLNENFIGANKSTIYYLKISFNKAQKLHLFLSKIKLTINVSILFLLMVTIGFGVLVV